MSKHKYVDTWGDIWVRWGRYYVQRIKDGNIGLWMDGKGLK